MTLHRRQRVHAGTGKLRRRTRPAPTRRAASPAPASRLHRQRRHLHRHQRVRAGTATAARTPPAPTRAGSFTCACKAGYTGNGVTCTDVNECTAGSGNCSANATCTNTAGSFTCACNAATRATASPAPTSTSAPRAARTAAKRHLHQHRRRLPCACNTGYTGNGVTLHRRQRVHVGRANCSPNANCTNTAGSFTCACKHRLHRQRRDLHAADLRLHRHVRVPGRERCAWDAVPYSGHHGDLRRTATVIAWALRKQTQTA